MTQTTEVSALDTLLYVQKVLSGVFSLMNAWADPDKAFMNDHSRYDAGMILAEVYARLAHMHTRVNEALEGDALGPTLADLQEEVLALKAKIDAAQATLDHIEGRTPVATKAGKREVIL